MLNSDIFNWIILPLLIFLARVSDVSLGTLRIIFMSRGYRNLAPVLGFFEILIWLLAIRQIFSNLNNPLCFLAYAAGFACGIYIGIRIEQKMAIGLCVVRIITRMDATKLAAALRNMGFGVTAVDAQGNTGPVKIMFTVIKRSNLPQISRQILHFNPKAFYSVEDIRAVSEGIFPEKSSMIFRFFKFEKKNK